ncbi:MAG TPA: acyl-CoA dehydrogenase family protein [Xanthobacteraceae bacterium]|nr:acyl-CoA dehydrogenase family protein [Xanthobacteraceae bacterium]
MNVAGSIVGETAARIFADLADPQTVNRATDDGWKTKLWQTFTDAGLTLAWVPEELGGAGASLAEGFEIITAAGRFAAPVPLAETMLAGWLLWRADMFAPSGPMTVAPARPSERIMLDRDGRLSGRVHGVPFASETDDIAVLASREDAASVALVERKAVRVERGESLAGDASDTVIFDGAIPRSVAPAPAGLDQNALMLMGAVIRSVATAGALETMLALTLRYAEERVAFERKIAKFQAVQHNLARLAGEVAAAMTAAGSAADAIANSDQFDDAIFLEAAAAKIRSAEAAQEGAAIAHQVHGAIGFTREHVLHRFTLRVLGWRDDFGNESHWAVELGNRVAARGGEAFWPLLASR